MPEFENFRKAVLRDKIDRIPIAELWVDQEVKEGFLGKPIGTVKEDIEFWQKAGYDYIILGTGLKGGEVLYKTGTTKTRQFYHNGEKERTWAQEGKGVISNEEDFERFDWKSLEEVSFAQLEQADELVPEGMKIIAYEGKIFTRTWMLMGFENFCLSLTENPQLVEKVFRKNGEIQVRIIRTIIHKIRNLGAIWISDDIGYSEGLFVSPKIYRRFLFPWYEEIGAICKEKDLIYLYHSDGRLWEIIEDLIACGFQGLHPIEPKAMEAKEVKDKYGDRLCLLGNVDLDTLSRGKPSEIEAMVKQRIETLGEGGGYCLGSSNTVTNYVPLENYKAMLKAAAMYGTKIEKV